MLISLAGGLTTSGMVEVEGMADVDASTEAVSVSVVPISSIEVSLEDKSELRCTCGVAGVVDGSAVLSGVSVSAEAGLGGSKGKSGSTWR